MTETAAPLGGTDLELLGAYGRAPRAYTRVHGDDDPEIRDWTWQA